MDRQFQDKLQQFSATPPDGVWNKIADALDAGENISQRLYQYEEKPPAAVWQKVENELNNSNPAKVIPFTRRSRKPLRYAAAACLLMVSLVTVTLSLKRTGTSAPETSRTASLKQTTVLHTPSEQQSKPEQTTAPDQTSGSNNTATVQQNKSTSILPEKRTEEIAGANDGIHHRTSLTQPVYSSLDDYVVYSDGDGQTRRVSKKLANFVNCKDDDIKCKQRLKELRQRMAAKAMTTDFTGILEMLRQLQ